MLAAQLMTRQPLTIAPRAGLDLAMRLMDEHDVRHLPVADGDRLVGILSDRDLLDATGWSQESAREPGPTGLARMVQDVMHRSVKSVDPETELVSLAVTLMLERVGSLPVVEGGRLVGIITKSDLLRAFLAAAGCGQLTSDFAPSVATKMTRDPVVSEPGARIEDAFRTCVTHRIRHLPIVHHGQLMGIVSDRDLRRLRGQHENGKLVFAAMTRRRPVTIPADADLRTAAARMLEERIGCLPVLEDGRLVGILTLGDLVDHCMGTLWEARSTSL